MTGGGFSARVSLVLGAGLVQEENSPEDLLERFQEVMSLGRAPTPVSSHEVRSHVIHRLGAGPGSRVGAPLIAREPDA